MPEEIINRVQKSGLITIDLDEFEISKNVFEIDIKVWLFEGLFLREKDYRNSLEKHDWSQYQNSYVETYFEGSYFTPCPSSF